jgi:hypothetical protein
MLNYEDVAKTHEIKGKFNKVWLSSEYLQAHLNILSFNKKKQVQLVLKGWFFIRQFDFYAFNFTHFRNEIYP